MKLIPLVVAGAQTGPCCAPQLHTETRKNLGTLRRDYGLPFIVSSNKRELSEAGGVSIKDTLHNGRLLRAPLKHWTVPLQRSWGISWLTLYFINWYKHRDT